MTEQTAEQSASSGNGRSAGALLRAARERRGMHIATLAASIKVSPARLEALEADDYSSMPDTTFARALAQAMCRALKVDPAPVLAQMPDSFHSRLERVDEGINAPFHDRPGRLAEVTGVAPWRSPVAWLALALLVAAAAFLWWPAADRPTEGGDMAALAGESMTGQAPGPGVVAPEAPAEPVAASAAPTLPVTPDSTLPAAGTSPATATPPAVAAASAATAVSPSLPILASAPGTTANPAAGAVPVAAGSGDLVLRAVQDSWMQVTDGAGKVLAARTFTAGETVAYNGPWPMRVRIGNVQGTAISFRGQDIDLKSRTRDNTVSLTLPPAGSP